MEKDSFQFWAKVFRAQDELVKMFLDHPDVSLIDIGYAPEESGLKGEVVLRIHVLDRWMQSKPEERIAFPSKIMDIPIIIMRGDYKFD